MSVSRLLIITLSCGALFAWWFAAGSNFVALVDRVSTVADGRPTSPNEFTFDEGNEATSEPSALSFGSRRRLVATDWRIVEKPAGHISLETAQGTLLLGALTRCSTSAAGKHSYTFVPEPGDVVSLTRQRSRLSWPRPFVVSWLGGRLPFWSRYVYDRLEWRKADGKTFDAIWRDEQRLNPGDSWMDMYDAASPTTTLRGTKG